MICEIGYGVLTGYTLIMKYDMVQIVKKLRDFAHTNN